MSLVGVGELEDIGEPAPSSKQRAASIDYERLRSFLLGSMSMSHIYQPLMIRTILAGGGAATRRQIAAAFLGADISQLEYYEHITKGYPTQTLRRHGIVDHDRGVYRLLTKAGGLGEWERASLIALCDAKVAEYVAQRQDAIWRHRTQNFEPIPGTLRYEVIKRAKGRCEACGTSNQERALQVDHIVPRAKGGSSNLDNLQALCSTCNAQKLDRDATDFHGAHLAYDVREPGCQFCAMDPGQIVMENPLAFLVRDKFPVVPGHMLVIPKRHVASYFELWQPEINAIYQLECWAAKQLHGSDETISGFNVEANSGVCAGQTTFHCHIHVIPRRQGDDVDPRGGVRGVSN